MTLASKDLIILGAGGHARVIIDVAEETDYRLKGIIDINYKNRQEEILGYPVLGDIDILNNFDPTKTGIAVAFGDCTQRTHYFFEMQKSGYLLPSLIHPTAIISKHAAIGVGVFINAGTIMNSKATVGDNTIINTGAIIEHEVTVGAHSHICPGVKIGGRVSIGDNTFIGIGTSIKNYVKVGDNVVIGAGSVVINNVESNSTIAGIPGKPIN